MKNKPTRKTNRLKDFDYSSAGDYFITICVNNRDNMFWKSDYKQLQAKTKDYMLLLNKNGNIAELVISRTCSMYDGKIKIDKYVIMPDHIHMIISILIPNVASVPQIVRQIKRYISVEIGEKGFWQKGYYDHIIRNEKDYNETWDYIDANPRRLTDNMFLK